MGHNTMDSSNDDFSEDGCNDDYHRKPEKISEIVDAHILKHFGIPKDGGFTASALFKLDNAVFTKTVNVHVIESERGIAFLTSGLSSYALGAKRFELTLALPPKNEAAFTESFSTFSAFFTWALRLLQNIAVFAITQQKPLEYGCSIDNGEPYTAGIDFSACILLPTVSFSDDYENDASAIKLDDFGGYDDDIELLRIVPLYKEELEYKLKYGYEKLFTKLLGEAAFDGLNPQRKNVCA
ncbi:MAG: hypothetical protein Ta2A_20090 [Treponemataceae bacterium]|nr:MAG: hypothetical protein Ta2A_20090 [Treponemataceae bacterium]